MRKSLGLIMLFNSQKHRQLLRRFDFIGGLLEAVFPFVKSDVLLIEPNTKPRVFLSNAFISALIIALLFSLPVYAYSFYSSNAQQITELSLIVFFYILFTIFILNIIHPHAYKADLAKSMDRDLSFMLKDIIIQVKSGVLLYDALVAATAMHEYGEASRYLREVINKINEGYNYRAALQEMASQITSEFMKKVLWQMTSIFTVGGDPSTLFESMEQILKEYHERAIAKYMETANVILFAYMLLGAVLPGIFLVTGLVTSIIMGFDFSEILVIGLLSISLFLGLFLIGYLKSSKPVVLS